jgi:type II secretion system protein C
LPEGLNEFGESDTIDNTDIKVLKIKENTVDFIYEGKTLSVSLTPPNLLATDYKETEKSYSEYLAMTPEEIGSRPRVIEHIVTLTPTPYIADGKLASIGINPALFDQAGLQEDDVVKTINGKSITVESEFDELKQEIPQATTLTFLVMRRGRLITLYLDIPSEGLTVTP